MILFLGLLVADAGSDAVPGLSLLSSSVLGVVIILAMFGWVWFKPGIDEIKERATKAESQRDDLIELYESKIIPTLQDVQDKLLPTLADSKQVLLEVKKELEFLNRSQK